MSKKKSKKLILEEGVIYFREPGAKTIKVAGPGEWQRLIEVCVRARQEDIGIVLEPELAPVLTEAARELLVEASQDLNGAIMMLGTTRGVHVQTNKREFVESDDARSAAQWKGAVDDLYELELIEDRVGTGNVFFVTDEGYRLADLLGQH